ncbi:MAG: hypothetical protein JNM93_11890 [Bacteriovoracaceae bacterium]|nr:hypothetical protein [Bacteriovoracaceae bacterium]
MKKYLEITLNTIKNNLSGQNFTAQRLLEALKLSEPTLPISTLRWRLYSLKNAGKIESPARGIYTLSKHEKFEPNLESGLYQMTKEIKKQFPYARFCIWPSNLLNQFTNHQPSIYFNIIEVEKDAIEGVFSHLKQKYKNMFLNPNKKEIDYYISSHSKSIIVKTLYQRAPLTIDQTEKNPFPKLEKILVDLIAEPDIFSIYQGSELKNIWREVCQRYAINFSTLNNYAKRRKVEGKVNQLIGELGLHTYREQNL